MKRRKVLLSVMILALVLVLTLGLLVACNDDQKTQYTVTFKDGDTEVATVRVDEGKALTAEQIPAGPDHNGEAFDGWYLDDQVIEAGYTPTADVTVTAKYHTVTPPTQYTVTFSLGDNTDGAVPAPKTVNAGASITLPDAVEWSGHTFDGWYLGTEKHDAGSQYTVNSSVEFVAHYSTITPPPAYTITFLDPDGNELGTATVGQVTRTPEGGYFADNPLAMGSFFEGWFLWEGNAYGDKINPSEYTEEESIVVKMKLTSLTSTTIDASYNGKWVVDDDEFGLCSFTTNGVTTTIMFAEGDEETVLGVFVDPDGGYYLAVATEVENTYNYHRVKLEDNGTITMHYIPSDSEDYTVSSLTKLNSYTVSFDAGDGSGSMSAVLAYEGEYTLPAPRGLIAPDGLEFYGWNSNVDGDYTLYKAGDTFDLHTAVTFTAQWSKTVTYKFVLGDEYTGSTVLPDVTQFASDVLVMPQVDDWADHYIISWKGYTNYDPEEGSGDYYVQKNPNDEYTQLSQFTDITWVATWQDGTRYTVSYWINGVKTDKYLTAENYIISNAPVSINDMASVTPEGYYFVGWFYATDDGTPTANPVQSSAQASENCSVVAVFESYGTAVQSIEEKFRGTFKGQYESWETVNIVLTIGESTVSYVEEGDYTHNNFSLTAGSKIYLNSDGAYIVDMTAPGTYGAVNKKFVITFVDETHLTIAELEDKTNSHSVEKLEVKSSYEVTYYSGMYSGLPGTQPESSTAAPGSTVTTLATCPWTRDGYKFLGWKVQTKNVLDDSQWDDMPEYLELSAGDTFVMPANDVRITARWEQIVITVVYNANGGNGNMDNGTVKWGSTLILDHCTFTPAEDNYVFAGWAFSSDGNVALEDGETVSQGIYESYVQNDGGNYTLTLYAIWKEDIPAFYTEADVLGKWTGDGHELIIVIQGYLASYDTDWEAACQCPIIFDGQYIEMMDDGEGGLQGVVYDYTDLEKTEHYSYIFVSKTDDGKIQVTVTTGHYDENGDEQEDGSNTYALDTHTAIDFENPDGSAFDGTYTRSETSQQLTLEWTAEDLYMTALLGDEMEPTAFIVGDYLIMFDYGADTEYGNYPEYFYVLKKEGDNLVGKYYLCYFGTAEEVKDVTFTKSEPTPPLTSDSFTFTGNVEASDMDGNEGTVTKIVLDSTTDPTTITVTVDGVDETITTIYDVTDIDGWYVILSSGMYLNFAIEGDTLTIYFDDDGDYSTDLGTLTLQA